MPVSNMENNNTRDHIEKVTKQLFENLKQISAVNVDHSSYRNRGGHPPPHVAFDEQENRQVQEDREKDINHDTTKDMVL